VLSAVVQRLRNGVPKDQMLPPFDPRSAVLYALLAFEVVLTFVVVRAMGFTFSPKLFHMLPAPVVFAALISGPLIRRLGHPRMGGLIETWALLGVQSLAAIFLLIPLTSISAPMADATLSRADALLGFHWLSLAAALRDHPGLVYALEAIYRSFEWQPPLVLLLLWARNQGQRAWTLMTALAVSLLITIAIYPFAPADGALVFNHVTQADYPGLTLRMGWEFSAAIHAIKGGATVIEPELMTGFVSFPSYHAAAAVMLAWAGWRTPLRWPMVLLNIAMAFSALLVGAHYLVDIVGGVIVAAVAVTVSRRLVADSASQRRDRAILSSS